MSQLEQGTPRSSPSCVLASCALCTSLWLPQTAAALGRESRTYRESVHRVKCNFTKQVSTGSSWPAYLFFPSPIFTMLGIQLQTLSVLAMYSITELSSATTRVAGSTVSLVFCFECQVPCAEYPCDPENRCGLEA